MDLDLNQEPLEPQSCPEHSPERLFVEMGDHHDRVVERIRLLESVVARTRFRTNPIPSSAFSKVPRTQHRFGSIKPGKIDGGTHLLAEALAMDSACEETLPSTSASTPTIQRKPGGSIYDCNICFSLSKDPVLTCCGHLFCWPCFYCLPSTDSYSSKECPVCEGEVLETDITPIYGAASSSNDYNPIAPVPSTFNSLQPVKIPPRPRARRIETVRQRLGYPPLPPNQRVNPILPHPLLPPTHYTTPRSRTTSLRQQPRNLFPGGPLGETIADHMAFFASMQQLPRTQTQPLRFHSGTDMEAGPRIFPSFAPVAETNSVVPLYPLPPQSQSQSQSQTGTSEGNPVTDGMNDSNETVVSGHSSSRTRASSNGIGLTVRGRRRRRRRG